ncbi:DUF1269 domain-containing protein [Yoonia vestfoldensis]|uniref:DUF1269 domain-containing protein n=1 Tax=Yoonia vestfoldensis TaxID=245188 RepID=UPI00037FFFE3|nr:DUF1269 domain-containing protein [Yoonia vestfoldensis]
MNTYVAGVFSSEAKARAGLRKLWQLDEDGALTVHGAAIVHRDDMGHIHMSEQDSDVGMRTAIGVGIGALLGVFARPAGVTVGALTGAAVGAAADAVTQTRRAHAAEEGFFTLKHGQSAFVAEISEDWTAILDDALAPMGGTIYRRMNTASTNAAFGAHYYDSYLYPYEMLDPRI